MSYMLGKYMCLILILTLILILQSLFAFILKARAVKNNPKIKKPVTHVTVFKLSLTELRVIVQALLSEFRSSALIKTSISYHREIKADNNADRLLQV